MIIIRKVKKVFSPRDIKWLRFAVELLYRLHITDKHVVYLWAIFAGALGAGVALFFEFAVEFVQRMLTGAEGISRVAVFAGLDDWHRLVVPVAGGLLAGLTLLFAHKFFPVKSTEYMEAVSLGNGVMPARPSLIQSLSAIFSIASGAAIGKEGPLVQMAAVAASTVGQRWNMSAPRLRLMVGCGATAGITAAFHTPLAACLFVSEIVFGTLTISILAPLLIAGSTSFLILHLLSKQKPIYEASFASFGNISEILLCILLAVIASCGAKGWLVLLKTSRKYLNGRREWLPVRLALAGLFVGALACYYPYVVGNGAEVITGLVQKVFTPDQALIFLVLKVVAVAVVFGCGTVGGALTPSLMNGALIGFLFSSVLTFLGVPGDHAVAYSMVGMAAFFATASNAPLTSLFLVLEFTMAGNMIFPLMIGVVCSYAMSRVLKAKSMYHDSLAYGPRSAFDKSLKELTLKDIARKSPQVVAMEDKFGMIASILLRNPGQNIFVEGKDKEFMGTILASDVMQFAKSESLANMVIAMDVMREDIPGLPSDMSLPDALAIFTRVGEDSFALLNPVNGRMNGVVNKNDLYQVISEIMKREKLS